MRFSLRTLFLVVTLVTVGLWVWQHLAIGFEYRPMHYDGTTFRFDYSILLEVH